MAKSNSREQGAVALGAAVPAGVEKAADLPLQGGSVKAQYCFYGSEVLIATSILEKRRGLSSNSRERADRCPKILDPKSRTAHEIAWQIVCEEKMIIEALENGKMEWAPSPTPGTMKEVVDAYAAHSETLADRWNALPAERWEGTVEFFGRERPAAPMAWGFLFDIVHHRGQITTYLRPMGSTVPQIYGPSGDEP